MTDRNIVDSELPRVSLNDETTATHSLHQPGSVLGYVVPHHLARDHLEVQQHLEVPEQVGQYTHLPLEDWITGEGVLGALYLLPPDSVVHRQHSDGGGGRVSGCQASSEYSLPS